MKHERDLNLNHTLLLCILRRKYWGRSFLYYSWIVHAERLRRRLFGKLEEAVYQRLAELATQAREWDFICSSSARHLFTCARTILHFCRQPVTQVREWDFISSLTRVLFCVFRRALGAKTREWDFICSSSFLLRACYFVFLPTACLLGAQVRFHLLCIGSCAFLYFALSPKWLLRRHASETPSTYHLLSYRLVLSILIQSLPRRV